MKPAQWLPAVVFLAVSIPVVMILQALDIANEYRLWLAIGAGAVATGLTMSRLAAREHEREVEPAQPHQPQQDPKA